VSVWVVVGGQYGSEGKGKISALITLQEDIDICIRCGGPNSGHSFVADDGTMRLVRQLPTGFVNPRTKLMIPAGAVVDLEVLRLEIEALGLNPDRVRVDRNAMIIEGADKENERHLQLRERLSSTLCGVGSAVARRAMRGADVRLAETAARTNPWLSDYLDDIALLVNDAIDEGQNVLVEGTQGFGLSLYHTREYPKSTSRDTTVAGCLSEVGVSPRLVTQVVLVLRTFPIRVAGKQAGSLNAEIDWKTIQAESGCPFAIEECTTVTKMPRRVARFDWQLALSATRINRPTHIAVNGLDYLCFADGSARAPSQLSDKSQGFVKEIETRLATPVTFLGVGPRISTTLSRLSRPSPVIGTEKTELNVSGRPHIERQVTSRC